LNPLFATNSTEKANAVLRFADNTTDQLGEQAVALAAAVLPPALRETAFAYACDMVLADGIVTTDEEHDRRSRCLSSAGQRCLSICHSCRKFGRPSNFSPLYSFPRLRATVVVTIACASSSEPRASSDKGHFVRHSCTSRHIHLSALPGTRCASEVWSAEKKARPVFRALP
jgi:hypothetical protein